MIEIDPEFSLGIEDAVVQVKEAFSNGSNKGGDSAAYRRVIDLIKRVNELTVTSGIGKWFSKESGYPIESLPKHRAFFDAGAEYSERLALAANRSGKSIMGCYETVIHALGDYPTWWSGRRFDTPVDIWVVGPDARTVRDTIQKELMGPIGEWGTGMIPASAIGKYSALQGTSGAIDVLAVKSKFGGWSRIGFKNYQQDLKSFMGTSRHLVWLDEEVPIEIYNECNVRTATTNGIMICTFTPLEGLTPMVVNFCKKADYLLDAKPLFTPDEEGEQAVGKDTSKAILQIGWDDVPWLSDEIKKRLLDDTPEHMREARSKGIPAMGAGNVYTTQLENVLCDPFPIPDTWPRMFALDVGWNRCLAKDSMVMLPDGTETPIQDLKVGDEVLAFDFKTEELVPTKVIDTFKGFADNMVTMGISDHQTMTCTDDHPFAHRAQPNDAIKFKTIKEINGRIREFQSVVLPSKWNPDTVREVCSADMARIVGYLLGDGCLTYTNRRLEFAQKEMAFIEDMRTCLQKEGCDMRSYSNNTVHHISGSSSGNVVLDTIRRLGLLGTNSKTKFIPKEFYTATREEIENLLVGLIHTDGSVDGGNVRYYTVSRAMADGVKKLCLRLGIYASISKDTRKRKASHNDVYRVTIRRPTCLPLLDPKRLKAAKPERKKRFDRLIDRYVAAPAQDIYCITVEHPDHAFVCNGFVVSNTACMWGALDPNTETIYLYDEYYVGQELPLIHAHSIKSRGSWIPGVIDPAANGRSQYDGAQLMREYVDLGLDLINARNDVEAGITRQSMLMATGKLKVFRTCKNWASEYIIYRRDKNGKVVKENDHALDTSRYIVMNSDRMASSADANVTGHYRYDARNYNV